MWRGEPTTWGDVDQKVIASVAEATREGKAVVLLSGTITSPSTRALIAELGARHPHFRHVSYDAVSASALRSLASRMPDRTHVPLPVEGKAREVATTEAVRARPVSAAISPMRHGAL